MKKKILVILTVSIFMMVLFVGKSAAYSPNESPEQLVNELFWKRTYLASSKDMSEFRTREKGNENLLSNVFINPRLGKQSTTELRKWIYGAAEGFGKFNIVKLIPLIRIYRLDQKDDTAVAYVEQFFMYKVKPDKNAKRTTRNIPEDWLVPVDENGAWTAATVNYYTVIMKKDENIWKIEKLIDADIGGTEYSLKIGLLFAGCGIKGFPNPPTEQLPLPEEINEELIKSSIGYKHITEKSTVQSPYRREAADYADSYWNNYNPSYATFQNDCANFVSQCFYESGGWSMDWNNNGVPESTNPPYPSQEWHIAKGTLNSSYSWCRADNMDYYVENNIDYKTGQIISPCGWTETYDNAALADVITLDQNGEGTADHVGIVAAFEYYTGTPLVDAHNNNQYHTSWAGYPILHSWRMDYELENYGAG
ncbi:MAG: amidase domain-containing protein [Caldisericaceae bacterium]|nr:amidase domain-containing protein [Caldisericaceae bacterium]